MEAYLQGTEEAYIIATRNDAILTFQVLDGTVERFTDTFPVDFIGRISRPEIVFTLLYFDIVYKVAFFGNLLAFWDKENNKETLVLAIKKTDKVPKKDIDRAVAIRAEYFESKTNKK